MPRSAEQRGVQGLVPETRALILALCRSDAPERLGDLPGTVLGDAAARVELVRLAREHRIEGLVLSGLVRAGALGALDAELQREWMVLLLVEQRRSARYEAELGRVAGIFDSLELDFAVLKGGSLRHTVYANPLQRRIGDLDILVPRDRFDAAVAALLDRGYRNPWPARSVAGYRAHHYHLPLHHPDGFIVEVHWELVKPGRPYALEATRFLELRSPTRGELPFRPPRPELQLLHTAVQQLQDGFAYLLRTVDVDRLLRAPGGLDWDLVLGEARRGGLTNALVVSLQLARCLLDTPVPETTMRDLDPGRAAAFHLALLRPVEAAWTQHFRQHPSAYELLRLWLLPDARTRRTEFAAVLADTHDEGAEARPWELDPQAEAAPDRGRLAAAIRLVGRQLALYAGALPGLLTPGGRAQMRFWSSHCKSSERL